MYSSNMCFSHFSTLVNRLYFGAWFCVNDKVESDTMVSSTFCAVERVRENKETRIKDRVLVLMRVCGFFVCVNIVSGPSVALTSVKLDGCEYLESFRESTHRYNNRRCLRFGVCISSNIKIFFILCWSPSKPMKQWARGNCKRFV